MKFIFDHRLTVTDLDPATRQHLKRRLTMQNPAHRKAEKAGRSTGGIPTHLENIQTEGF